MGDMFLISFFNLARVESGEICRDFVFFIRGVKRFPGFGGFLFLFLDGNVSISFLKGVGEEFTLGSETSRGLRGGKVLALGS